MTMKTVGHPVLLVSSRSEDHSLLQEIFRNSPWELLGAFTVAEGLRLLRLNYHAIFVAICEQDLPDGDWKSMLAELDKLVDRPKLIVSSRLADERLWAEVLNLGAFDLLVAEPFEPREVLHITESAWRAGDRPARNSVARRIPPQPDQRLKALSACSSI